MKNNILSWLTNRAFKRWNSYSSINLYRKDIKEITVEKAEEVLRDILLPNEKREVTPELIIQTVAEHYGITMADIAGNKRNNDEKTDYRVSAFCTWFTDGSTIE